MREYRLSILHDLLDAYNGIKTARRSLPAFCLQMPQSGSLSAGQIAEYRSQSRSLMEIQLSLEKIVRELETRPDLFRASDGLRDALDDAETYVHDLGRGGRTTACGSRKARMLEARGAFRTPTFPENPR